MAQSSSDHPLSPLLRPRSIAVLGASEREHTVGSEIMHNLQQGGYEGRLYPVNPGRETVFGLPCFPSLSELPETVDQVIFAIADTRVESALDDTIAHGAKAVTLFSTLLLDNETAPLLRDRVTQKIRQSGLLVCGANGMGFYNFQDGIWACGFDTRNNHPRGGNVTLISHSGSGMSGILDCEERIDFNLAVSTGQELCVTMDQYMDYAIEEMNTRVVGLFLETARNPSGLRAVLAKAADRNIPVIAIKVGRTDLAAELTVSHSGAMAGEDAAYQALFDRYGVQRVEDMDELATTLIMFAQPHPVSAGGLVSIHDSGGERQLIIDLADRVDLPLTKISPYTTATLKSLLDPGLMAVNPLDAWSKGGPHYHKVMEKCFSALMTDEGAAMGAVVHDRAPHGEIYEDYIGYMRAGHKASGKPAFLVSNRQGTGADERVVSVTREGFPVLDGLRSFLVGARCLLNFRDFQAGRQAENGRSESDTEADQFDGVARKWRGQLSSGLVLDEYESGRLLADFSLPVNPGARAENVEDTARAASAFGYPVALKSAQAGLLHKTDKDGVRLHLHDEEELRAAYNEMAARLGHAVLISPMITEPGVEMILGVVRDEQFGPLVVMGFGGVHVEAFKDVVCALPPFNETTARRLLGKLKLHHLLLGHRNLPAVDSEAMCTTAAQFSRMVRALGDCISEIDVNPILVKEKGCIALDALVAGHPANEHTH